MSSNIGTMSGNNGKLNLLDRKNFGKLQEVIDVPNLIQNQIDSFKEFLQPGISPNQRRAVE